MEGPSLGSTVRNPGVGNRVEGLQKAAAPLGAALAGTSVGLMLVLGKAWALAIAAIPLLAIAFLRLDIPALMMALFPIGTATLGIEQVNVFRATVTAGAIAAVACQAKRRAAYVAVTVIALAGFGVFMLVLLPRTADPVYARRALVNYAFASVMFGFALVYGTTGKKSIRSLVYVILAVGVADAALSLTQTVLGMRMPEWYLGSVAAQDVLDVYKVEGRFSAFGFFPSRGENALFLLLPLCLVVSGSTRLSRSVRASIAALIVAAILATFSRTVVLLLPLVVIGALIGRQAAERKPVSQSAVVAGIVLLTVYVGAAAAAGTPLLSRLDRAVVEYDFKAGRAGVWQATIAAVQSDLPLGVGVGGLASVPLGAPTRYPHSAYVELVAETGAVGLSLWLLVAFVIARRYRAAWRRVRENAEFSKVVSAFGIYFAAVLAYSAVALSFRWGWAPATLTYVLPDMVLLAFAVGRDSMSVPDEDGIPTRRKCRVNG